MTERIRLIVDTEDSIRRAVHLRRLKMPSGTTVSDVVNEILRASLAEEIRQLESYPRQGEAGAKKKGRKRKRPDEGEGQEPSGD